ncbi:tetratricopeptide repeat protein [Hymenobacter rubidus]|uniref:tetratricopeptide repeat protein n=1 Tax=Hymenobacter rubidus TaxID=1441626 RepID=UPI00191CA4F7|nr:tetratricopeptide repeat protein [Hymenobacter rubidus]
MKKSTPPLRMLLIPLAIVALLSAWRVVTGAGWAVHIAEGFAAYKAGAYGDAEVRFRQALRVVPALGAAQYNLGNALYQQGRYSESTGYYRQAIHAQTPAAQAGSWANLGNALYQSGRLAESDVAYRKALLLLPDDAAIRQDFLFIQRQVASRLARTAPKPKASDAASQNDKSKTESQREQPNANKDERQEPNAQELNLTNKSVQDVLGQLNEQESKVKMKKEGRRQKLRNVTSDEKDY